jgi:hypothetical protein
VEKFKVAAERLDIVQRAALDLRIVKIVQVIKSPNAMAVEQQAFANMRADEARATRDEKMHGAKLISPSETVERVK